MMAKSFDNVLEASAMNYLFLRAQMTMSIAKQPPVLGTNTRNARASRRAPVMCNPKCASYLACLCFLGLRRLLSVCPFLIPVPRQTSSDERGSAAHLHGDRPHAASAPAWHTYTQTRGQSMRRLDEHHP